MNAFIYICVSVAECNIIFIAVQVRRERFVEELESYQKQVEEFATYGDMNEIQKYLRKSQNLETKLTAAAEKVGKQFGFIFIFLNDTSSMFNLIQH